MIDSRARRLAVILAGLGLLGGLALALCMPWGAGLSPDSVLYVAAARNLLGGGGLGVSFDPRQFSPLTHYPPLYPVLLAGAGLSGIDPVDAAGWLGAALFAANIVMTGRLVQLASRSAGAAALAALLFMSAPPMAQVHTMAWSEPLFIACELLGFIFLASYLERPRRSALLAAALAAALACLVRYAGAALVLTGAAALAWLGRAEKKKSLAQAGFFALAGAAPVVAWLVRNHLVAGSATNRAAAFHPPSLTSLSAGFDSIAGWFFPAQAPLGSVLLPLLVLLCAYPALARRSGGVSATAAVPAAKITSLLALWSGVYVIVLFLSMAFFDADIPLDSRILSPLYPAWLIVGVNAWAAAPASSENRRLRMMGAALGAILVCSQLAGTVSWLAFGYRNGIGYASRSWRESPLARRLAGMGRAPVFTNAPEAVYLVTGLAAFGIPAKIDSQTRAPNAAYPVQLAALLHRLQTERGVLVYFKTVTWRWYLPPEAELAAELDLRILAREDDGTLYEAGGGPKLSEKGTGEN